MLNDFYDDNLITDSDNFNEIKQLELDLCNLI